MSFSIETLGVIYGGGGGVNGMFSPSSREVVRDVYAGSGRFETTCSSCLGAVGGIHGSDRTNRTLRPLTVCVPESG